jgi:protein TonB
VLHTVVAVWTHGRLEAERQARADRAAVNRAVAEAMRDGQDLVSPIDTPLLSPTDLARLLDEPLAEPPAPPTEPPTEPPRDIDRPSGQVVEILPPAVEQVPDTADLVSDFNSKVEREQVSVDRVSPKQRMEKGPNLVLSGGDDPKGNTSTPSPSTTQTPDERPQSPVEGPGVAQTGAPGLEAERQAREARPEVQPNPLREGLEPAPGGDQPSPLAAQPAAPRRPAAGSPDLGGGSPAPLAYRSLLASLGPEPQAASTGSIDHLPNRAEGKETLLNTREYMYAWAFNRIKEAISQRWRPGQAYRAHDPYGRVYGVKDRETMLHLTLRPDGTLYEVYVLKESGVGFLDDVAIDAVREAQPFPNLPKKLVEPDGFIHLKFAFHLDIRTGGFQFFRAD